MGCYLGRTFITLGLSDRCCWCSLGGAHHLHALCPLSAQTQSQPGSVSTKSLTGLPGLVPRWPLQLGIELLPLCPFWVLCALECSRQEPHAGLSAGSEHCVLPQAMATLSLVSGVGGCPESLHAGGCHLLCHGFLCALFRSMISSNGDMSADFCCLSCQGESL